MGFIDDYMLEGEEETAVEICRQLSRIAIALEALKPLAECVSTNQRSHAFCITGDVTSYRP